MLLFKTSERDEIARALCSAIHLSNSHNILCGQGLDQVYGAAYVSLKNLMVDTFGEFVTEYAMERSKAWCVSDFDGQVCAAIEEAISEEKLNLRAERAKKMIDFLNEKKLRYAYDHYRGDGFIAVYDAGGDEYSKLSLDWNEIHMFVENQD